MYKNYCFLFILGIWISSCNIYKQVPENETVLIKNQINIIGKEKDLINDFFYRDELFQLPVQKPNKKVFGIPISQHIWAFYNKKKITQFSQFMKNKIGNAPIFFDSSKLERSKDNFENYYFNLGYFDNEVQVDYARKKKKTTVTYNVVPKEVYRLRTIYFDTISPLQKLVYKSRKASILQSGDDFNINNFLSETDRITDVANNNGYYSFNKEYIKYRYDTFKNKHELDVYVKVLEESDSTNFEIYRVDSLRVLINSVDENQGKFAKKGITEFENIRFVQDLPRNYSEKFLKRFIFEHPDSSYSKEHINRTVQRLTELGNFKLINSSVLLKSKEKRELDLYYALTPYRKHSTSLGLYAYASTLGLLGTSVTATYANKNLTKKADKLSLSLSASTDVNFFNNQTQNEAAGFIARLDFSLASTYNIEKFVLPLFFFSNSQSFLYNRTVINSQYSYSKRLGYYDIHNLGTSLGYEWSKKKSTVYSFQPFAINFIYIPPGSIQNEFQITLDKNPFLKTSFSSAFLLGSSFSYSHRVQYGKYNKNSLVYRSAIETAGNTTYLADQIFGNRGNSPLTIYNTDVSQYIKMQSEVVNNNSVNKKSSIHSRVKLGIGFPYGLSNKLPYIKQSFIGGQYSLRAFQARTIGPGSFNPGFFDTDSTKVARDQLGNLLLEANLEYRFNIISFLKGAIFMDMGNIWNTSRSYSSYDETIFKFSEFYKQMYIGTGAGIRFDLNYFVVRLDLGIPLRVPYLTENDWVIVDAKPFNGTWLKNNMIINFAVGFPF